MESVRLLPVFKLWASGSLPEMILPLETLGNVWREAAQHLQYPTEIIIPALLSTCEGEEASSRSPHLQVQCAYKSLRIIFQMQAMVQAQRFFESNECVGSFRSSEQKIICM